MKIKEGGGMDIEKVKELALINGFKLIEQASGNMDLNAYVYDFANAIEREVRAQADQKIKLLLCDEHLKKCESPIGIFNSQYPDEEPCLICLAKEAKAQAVPEWIETAIQPPEEGQKVIISGIYGVGIAEFSYLYKDEFVMYDMGASNPILSKDQVKFWQPLPDAPQEPAND